jgi:hypothetical protein
MKTILAVNAHLKYTEYLLKVFDNYPDDMTLKEIREGFEQKFSTRHILLNQNFGIYRLMPLLLIREECKKDNECLKGLIKQIKTIRNSIAHNNFLIDEVGYHFNHLNDAGKNLSLTYDEFVEFVHRIENEFYETKKDNS